MEFINTSTHSSFFIIQIILLVASCLFVHAAANCMVWTAELSAAVGFVIHSLAVLLHCTHWKADLAAAVYHNHACVGIALAPVCCSCVAILPCIHLQLLNCLSLVGRSKSGAHVADQISFQVCFQAPFLIPIFGLAEQCTYRGFLYCDACFGYCFQQQKRNQLQSVSGILLWHFRKADSLHCSTVCLLCEFG